MPIENDLEKEKKKIDKEEKLTVQGLVADSVYQAAGRRIPSDKLGRIGIIAGYLIMIMADLIVKMVQSRGIISLEIAVWLMIGLFTYGGWIFFQKVTTLYSLRAQEKAIKLDMEELDNEKKKREMEYQAIVHQRDMAEREIKFKNEQEWLIKKYQQDLQLREPFFREVQNKFMEVFTNPDTQRLLTTAPTLAKTVADMDKLLSQRDSSEEVIGQLKTAVATLIGKISDMSKEFMEMNKLTNLLVQREAEIQVKINEIDIKASSQQTAISSMNSSLETINKRVENIEKSKLPAVAQLTDTVIITKEKKEEPAVVKNVSAISEKAQKTEDEEDELLIPPPPK